MRLLIINQTPLLLFVIVFAVFGTLSDRFLTVQNLTNILVQSGSIGIVAIGMTLVLLTAGVDLSVGSVMFVAVAVAGTLVNREYPLPLAAAAAIGSGAVCGSINAYLVTRWKVVAFIATLGMLFVARGFGLWMTNTRAMNMPDSVTRIGSESIVGIPIPVIVLLVIASAFSFLLRCTPWGRQVYAIGNDSKAARKAGLRVDGLTASVYVISGVLAAIGGLVALSQTGAVSSSFGQEKEFAAIAAAVLGGTSLFGGRGSVLPGAIFGAVLFQAVENGLVIVNANEYLYPMILSGIIFFAVLVDTSRQRVVRNLAASHVVDPIIDR